MLPSALRLRAERDFKRVYRRGRRVEGEWLTLWYGFNRMGACRFGFPVSKKVGKANVRNRSKRLLREVCFRNRALFKPGHDVIISVRRSLNDQPYRDVEAEVLKMAAKAKLLLA